MSGPIVPSTVSGRELYALLPTVYRVRDQPEQGGQGHLAAYLDACGALLDRLRATLEQRLADAFPAAGSPTGADALEPQTWLLPYHADLLDARLHSPFAKGRRTEVARAVAWRQRKGTLAALEEIAEEVGGFEVEAQEGWLRVAVTPRIGQPLLPAAAFGEPSEPDRANPLLARRHPGLPTVTPDVGRHSRAIACAASHPRAQVSTFRGVPVAWRQLDAQGAPCFPGSFEDASRRTVDVRTPSARAGQIHPRRLLLFVPPTEGFFPFNAVLLPWGERNQPAHRDHVRDSGGDPRSIVNPKPAQAVMITTSPPPFDEAKVVIEDLVFDGTVHLTAGRIVLRRSAVKRLVVDTADGARPVIEAVDCLFDEVEAPDGLVRLEATTVMKSLDCRRLLASDSLLAGTVTLAPRPGDARSCTRYSRVPRALLALPIARLERASVTTAEPIFLGHGHCTRDQPPVFRPVDRFGDPGYGVLDVATPEAICAGAEDGGEMGGDHHRAPCLARAAVLAKLEEFLPVGIEAVLVPDSRLLVPPPRTQP